jgi:cobalt-zinc-cadmium resistance protein CzcA
MVHKLIEWAVNNTFIVVLLALVLVGVGSYAFINVNVEAYPDPAPAIIEVVAAYPGFTAEEVERLVTVPLEVALSGMPGLQYTRSKSLSGLSHLRNQFEYGVDDFAARQEVINRLGAVQGLPNGVNPQISPFTPTGELVRYTLTNPRDPSTGRPYYTLHDLKAVADWTLDREFRRIPRIAGLTGFGGTVKRYEVHPDPERLKQYGITLQQLSSAIANSNANVGAGYLTQGGTAQNVRGVGLFGRGLDPMQQAFALPNPFAASRHLRDEEKQRVEDLLGIVVASVNNVPVRVRDLVARDPAEPGVAVGFVPRQGSVAISRVVTDGNGNELRDKNGERVWEDLPETVQDVVLMRKNEATLKALGGVKDKIKELNETPGRLLPGMQLRTHFDLTGLLEVTTETVRENLIVGMILVSVILLMFLSNVRSALIVAINIPLAFLFAFTVLFVRGKSANLLSIGAVDFGIIVDSSVIIVENIYRHVSTGENADLPLKERIVRACHEVEKPLIFSTLIMVCAFLPLFTMRGPEGQIFGPMADTYAFALGGALLLALTVAPVLCLLFFKNLKPKPDNFFVQFLKRGYLRQLERCLDHRFATLTVFAAIVVVTGVALPMLGREFMPELEEGNVYIRGTLRVNVSLEEASAKAQAARAILRSYEEVTVVQSQVGRPDDGTDPTGFYNVEFSVPLKPDKEWPAVMERHGLLSRILGAKRPRTKPELVKAMNEELDRKLPGVDWNFSQYIRDNVMESLSGVKGDNSVKLIGPDLDVLERLAEAAKIKLDSIRGVENVGVFRIKGQPNLEFTIDRRKCERWNVSVKDVQTAIQVAVGGQAFNQMIEGEKTFDIALRWPARLRGSEQVILDLPIDLSGNVVVPTSSPTLPATPVTGQTTGVSPTTTMGAMPALVGSILNGAINNLGLTPRLRLRDLVTPVNQAGQTPDAAVAEGQANGLSLADAHTAAGLQTDGTLGDRWSYLRSGASTIYREQGRRLIAVKFSVNNKLTDLASAVARAQAAVDPLMPPGYATEWAGEFRQMKEAEARLGYIVPVAMGLIVLMLYLAFHDLLDMFAVLSNVVALCLGGIWALLLTGHNFSISAAVGFISIFGVAIMDGLLSISSFNALRAQGKPLRQAILEGAGRRVRPMMMTALTAIFGLLPAALSTKIGSQTQRPLAIVVVGGMVMTLLLNRYLMPVLYSFYGHREPHKGSGSLAH